MLAFEKVHLLRKKNGNFFFTHQQIKFAKSKLVDENLLVCNRLNIEFCREYNAIFSKVSNRFVHFLKR